MTIDSPYRDRLKYILAFAIALCIIVLSIALLIVENVALDKCEYVARDGVLDLRDADLASRKLLPLNGEWQFFPNRFISSGDENLEGGRLINVPSSWDLSEDKRGEVRGYGTYRLLVKVPESRFYAIKTNTIRYSANVILNGEKVVALGEPSSSRDSYIAESKYLTGLIHSHGD